MPFAILAENVFNGLTLGAFYAMVTLGLSLIFGVVRLVNFAHGDLFMMGAIRSCPAVRLTELAAVSDRGAARRTGDRRICRPPRTVAIRPIIDKSWRIHAVATLGISIILQNVAQIIFTTDPRQTPTPYSTQILSMLGFRISVQRIIVLVVAALVFIGLQWFVKQTKMGKAMRAVSQNREMCRVVGIDVRTVSLVTFALSGAWPGGRRADRPTVQRGLRTWDRSSPSRDWRR